MESQLKLQKSTPRKATVKRTVPVNSGSIRKVKKASEKNKEVERGRPGF